MKVLQRDHGEGYWLTHCPWYIVLLVVLVALAPVLVMVDVSLVQPIVRFCKLFKVP